MVAGPHVQLTVEDNGPGMTSDLVAEFLHPSPLPEGATHGLGHRIVQELSARTGGELFIEASPGTGTIFRLEWPIPATNDPSDLSFTAVSTAPPSTVPIEGQ